MPDRNQVIKLLTKAREAVADRIAEMVNDADDFVEDFTQPFSAFDELLELGERLTKLTYMISHMPANSRPVDAVFDGESDPWSQEIVGIYAPPAVQPGSWDRFVNECDNRSLLGATGELVSLLRIDHIMAQRCVAHFAAKLVADRNDTVGKLNSLTAQLRINTSGTLNLLRELFNIQGQMAINVYNRLRGV